MINPKLKAGCGVFTVFALGFGLGAFSLLLLIVKVTPLSEGWKTKESKTFVSDQLAKKLRLTEEQKKEFRPLVDEALERRWELRRKYLLEDHRLMEEEFLPRISGMLTDEQRQRAQNLLDRWRREQGFKLDPKSSQAEGNEEDKAEEKAGESEKKEADPAPSTE